MARSGAYLFGSGATLALIWLFLPVSGQVDTGAMLAMVGASYAMVALLIAGYDRIPEWGFKAFLFGFTLIVSGMIFYSGKSASPYSFFYVWAALYALHFFSTPDAARHVLFMGFCYAAVLVAHHWIGQHDRRVRRRGRGLRGAVDDRLRHARRRDRRSSACSRSGSTA